jgi:hypothetical protein
MKQLLTAILLCAICGAQNLPDAPKPGFTPTYRTWKQVFKDPLLYTNIGVDAGLANTDAYESTRADDRGCIENYPGGNRPNNYKRNIPEMAAMTIVTIGLLKLHVPRWIVPLMLIAPAIEHGKGIHQAIGCR